MTDFLQTPEGRAAVEAMRDVRNRRPVNSTMNCEAQLTAAFPHLDRLFRERHAQELVPGPWTHTLSVTGLPVTVYRGDEAASPERAMLYPVPADAAQAVVNALNAAHLREGL